ncbi:uncharacterized protein E5676_scaffold384G001370 [Cucumis melo var. makuwa]|uniref:Uncharacterized protein n=1 Tax=Cucumis melo var. makuwa TaxID=1194695 RepID=A0A5D3DWP3_CUCMM|nr:uncharacterized protein E6C27_scaffold271G001440 [Cucumis melo var. makuwa]TYK27942.1 uncharacterized protein E5676_scaffold384G001370 [Cucumis melo var. makuwa]
MQSQPLQNLGATVNLWFVLFGLSYLEETKSTGSSSKPAGVLVFSDALSMLEVHKSDQKLYLVWPRGNRPSLQTRELDKTIELPVPDTLPTSAESSGSNSSTWLELYFESVHVEMFYKGQQGSLEETHLSQAASHLEVSPTSNLSLFYHPKQGRMEYSQVVRHRFFGTGMQRFESFYSRLFTPDLFYQERANDYRGSGVVPEPSL